MDFEAKRKCAFDEERKVMRAQSRRTDTLIRVFSEFHIPLCFAGQFVISMDPQPGVEDQSERWRRSRKEKDEPGGRGGRRYRGWGRFDGKSRLCGEAK